MKKHPSQVVRSEKFGPVKAVLCGIAGVMFGLSALAATYPNGTFRYAAPTLPVNPTGTPGTQYVPATKDDVGLLNAINAAHANGGGQIILASGTYTINKRVALQNNISILGAGKGSTIIKRGSGFPWTSGTWTELLGAMDAVLHDFYIQNLTLDGGFTYSQLMSSKPYVYSLRISSTADDAAHLNQRVYYYNIEVMNFGIGLNMGNSAEITVDNCYFHANGCDAVFESLYIRNVKDVLIKNCEFGFAFEGLGVKVAGGLSNYPNEAHNVTITGNYFHDNGWADLYVGGMQGVRIYNNTCTYAGSGSTAVNNNAGVLGGITLYNEVGSDNTGNHYNSNVDVVNNIVQNNKWAGIELEYSNGLNVQGNRCNGTTSGNNYNGPTGVTGLVCDYNTQ